MPINYADINKNSKALLSVIRLSMPYTGETLNIGIILKNQDTGEVKIKTIENFKNIKSCFQLSEHDNIEYAIEILQKRQSQNGEICIGELSRSLTVLEPSKHIITSLSMEEELNALFAAKVSLSKKTGQKRNINPFSKTKLITNIQNVIKEKKWSKELKTRKHLPTVFGEDKEISLVSMSKNTPVVATQLISLHVDFWDTFQNALLLRHLHDSTITDKIIYMPIIGNTSGLTDKIRFVKEQASKEDLRLIDSSDYDEILHFMKEKADKTLL